jgi:hypothetical protein
LERKATVVWAVMEPSRRLAANHKRLPRLWVKAEVEGEVAAAREIVAVPQDLPAVDGPAAQETMAGEVVLAQAVAVKEVAAAPDRREPMAELKLHAEVAEIVGHHQTEIRAVMLPPQVLPPQMVPRQALPPQVLPPQVARAEMVAAGIVAAADEGSAAMPKNSSTIFPANLPMNFKDYSISLTPARYLKTLLSSLILARYRATRATR